MGVCRRMISAAVGCARKGGRWISHRMWWSFSALGASSLFWLLLRTGTRPTRIVYPCQKVAAANVHAWAGLGLVGLFIRLRRRVWKFVTSSRLVPVSLAAVGVAVLGLVVGNALNDSDALRALELQRAAQKMEEILAPSPSIFVVENAEGTEPEGTRHVGLDRLIDLMGVHGLFFYRTDQRGIACSPDGLIGPEDVVLIKVNCQWAERGGSNTDVLKGLIHRITNHPDGFTGEIVVADNGQVVNNGGSLDWTNSNAEDHGQSVQDVVNLFAGPHRVSTYHWTTIRSQTVAEFDQNDMTDGYVLAATPYPGSSFRVSYPKFKTTNGTAISFKRGIYKAGKGAEPGTYDRERLKVINLPVLKSHSGFGVTACVKHYMGLQSEPLSNGHGHLSQGSMGILFSDLGLPTLNILDATYVNAIPGSGPSTSYAQATKVDTLMASTDPFALDYWASKNVLIPTAQSEGYSNVSSMDPDLTGNFRTYLQNAKNIAILAGYPVTTDSRKITVFAADSEKPLLTDVTSDEAGRVHLQWQEIASGTYRYTVEQCTDLQGGWEPVPGTVWPIAEMDWTSEDVAATDVCFYRVRRDLGPK